MRTFITNTRMRGTGIFVEDGLPEPCPQPGVREDEQSPSVSPEEPLGLPEMFRREPAADDGPLPLPTTFTNEDDRDEDCAAPLSLPIWNWQDENDTQKDDKHETAEAALALPAWDW